MTPLKKLLHTLYRAIPFKYELYLLIRKTIRLPHRWHQHFYFTGVFETSIGDKKFLMKNYGYQFHVENEYFWGGIDDGWEKHSTKLWIGLCKTSGVILDIGANTGCFSLIAKTIKQDALVYAFEPMTAIADKLQTNIELNNYNIQLSRFALSNYTGEATIYPTSLDHVYSVTVNKNLFENEPVHKVIIATKRLDEFIRENNLPKIDLIKLDVETHEREVLEGMGEFLNQMRPEMLIEIQTDEIGGAIERMLNHWGYLYFNINEELGVRQVQSLTKSDWLNFLICKPETAKRLGLA